MNLPERIAAARALPGRPHAERTTSHTSLGALLAERARTDGDRSFLTFLGEGDRIELTYAEFARRVEGFADYLATLHDIRPGDRIVTLSVNHHQTVTAYFAAWWLGAVIVPVNCAEEDDRVAYMIENCGAKLIVAHGAQMDRAFELSRRCPNVAAVVPVSYAGNRPGGAHASGARPPVDPALDLEALIVYTSGTTGPPKGVVLTQYNLLADAGAIAGWHGFGADSRIMCVLPIHHVNGTVVTLVTPVVAGSSLVLSRKFSVSHFFESIGAENVQVVSVVPTLLKYLLEHHGKVPYARDAVPTLRYLICGAGPLTVELAAQFEERFGVRILHGYGLSETTCYSCFLPVDLLPAEHRRWMSEFGFPSIGAALPVNELAILDDQDRPQPPGERGEICARGHNVMVEYFARPDANESAFRAGWFHTGDEGFWQPGPGGTPYFFITGRLKELIVRGGVKVAPLELDEVLSAIPGVRRAMAVGFESTWYGEEVGAYVEPDPAHHPAITSDAVVEHCRKILPFHKQPKVVILGADFPVTSTGKYQRNRLRPLFAAWKEVQFRDPAKAC